MTTKEIDLVSRLRIKMGDNPSYEGKPIIADQVWEDAENLVQLNGSLVILFKGDKSSLALLTPFQEECLVLHARIELIDILTVDSTRYAKYSMRDTSASRISPQEFIALSKALNLRLRTMLEESGEESSSMNPKVTEGVMKRYDRQRDIYIPSKFDSIPDNLPFVLTSSATGVTITIAKLMIPDYNTHYLYRNLASELETSYGTIIKEYYELQDSSLLDDEVTDGIEYRYTLVIEDVNNNTNFAQKTITHSIV